ncbi:hypothetical protein HO173_004276 [Letharia columbiana]|uniref:Uncharacterized protein n=1 Tax=Letharia columbiana TaxID=112416 RepID=A0A8H6FYV8_9LECA|nr:uncharacterized protein HO173_004276 [Letharia columbiana]KAF6237386.1 hypothetical protein HO173_004276 [Letharia columbiana]
MRALSVPLLSLLSIVPLLHYPFTAAQALPLTLLCNTADLISACTAKPLLVSCPATGSASQSVTMAGFDGTDYGDGDNSPTTDATGPACFCQCRCLTPTDAQNARERRIGGQETAPVDGDGAVQELDAGFSDDESDDDEGGGSGTSADESDGDEGGEVPAPAVAQGGSMTTVASSASVATSTTASATTTTSAVVEQLGPHAGSEGSNPIAL